MWVCVYIHTCTVKTAERENHSATVEVVIKLFYLSPKNESCTFIATYGKN